MLLSDVPVGSRYFDVDGAAVVLLPGELSAMAFRLDNRASYPYPNVPKVRQEGDELSAQQFANWLKTEVAPRMKAA